MPNKLINQSISLTPSHTRPIANLCELSKLFERIIHNQIVSFVKANNNFDSRQSGFRSAHSTQSALLGIVNKISLGIDQRRVTILVLFDFSKAFNTVSHCHLLTKLKKLNFSDSALSWLFSYLSGRSQSIVDGTGLCLDWWWTVEKDAENQL